MKQCSRFTILSMVFIGMLCVPAYVNATDLTTFGDVTVNELDGRIARYVTYIGGQMTADTAKQYVSQGLYDYVSYPRASKMPFRMNNGITDGDTSGTGEVSVNTYNLYDSVEETDLYEIYFGTEEGYPLDFFGYKFKQAATVESINYDQWVYDNGGTFAATPDVQVLSGGTWTTVAASWDVPYNNAFGVRNESYAITLDTPATNVMGVRLIGDAMDSPAADDMNGFVSVTELQVTGTANVAADIDLTTNLAYGQDTIWTHGATQKGRPEILTDGNCSFGDGTTYDTTFDEAVTATEDFVGVMFDTPQSDVAAIGAVMVMFRDGGYFTDTTLRVEYATSNGEGGYNWATVTGLDLGSYDDNYAGLKVVADTNQPRPHPDRFLHSELLTFDTINVDIDGIRMIGTAQYADDDTKGDGDGFIGMMEFEAFAAIAQEEWPPGDANKDNKVDASDATILAGNWQAGVGAPDPDNITWEMGDFNGDGMVDASDATILAGNWQYGVGGTATAVPEPSTILLLLAACLALLPRWIRR